jgi:tRNA(Ser,Leu) C12 N-acetylase TAN1
MIEKVAKTVGPNHKVDLNYPDVVILVEIYKASFFPNHLFG